MRQETAKLPPTDKKEKLSPQAKDAWEAIVEIARLPQAIETYVRELREIGEGSSQILPIMAPRSNPKEKSYVVGFEINTPFHYLLPLGPLRSLVAARREVVGELKMRVVYAPYQQLKEGHTIAGPGNPWGDINIVRDREGNAMAAFQKRKLTFSAAVRLSDGAKESTYPLNIDFSIEGKFLPSEAVLAEEDYDFRRGWHHRVDYSPEEVREHINSFLAALVVDWLPQKIEFIDAFLGKKDKKKRLGKRE